MTVFILTDKHAVTMTIFILTDFGLKSDEQLKYLRK